MGDGDEAEEAEASGSGEDRPQAQPIDSSWAHQHPWGLAIITSLIVAVLVGGFSWVRNHNNPIAIGRSGTIGSWTYTLTDFGCEPESPKDRQGEYGDGSTEPDRQRCEADFSVRNNGNKSGTPSHDMILHVGDNRFENVFFLTGDIFPDQSVDVGVDFGIPLGADPTQLRITPGTGGFLDVFVPFYNDWVTYDLG